ncbi:MAG: hypothetical protein ACRYG8_03170 [Janthinobacterium lividum]
MRLIVLNSGVSRKPEKRINVAKTTLGGTVKKLSVNGSAWSNKRDNGIIRRNSGNDILSRHGVITIRSGWQKKGGSATNISAMMIYAVRTSAVTNVVALKSSIKLPGIYVNL